MQHARREPFPAAPDPDDSPVGIVALWRLLWGNKWRIALPAVVLTTLAAVLVLRSEDIYTAEAQVLLTRGNLEIIEFDSAGGFEVTPAAIANALAILASRGIQLDVVERLNLTDTPTTDPALIPPPGEEAAVDPEVGGLRDLALQWLRDTPTTDPALIPLPEEEPAVDPEAELRYLALQWLGEVTQVSPVPGTNVINIRAVTTAPELSSRVANAYAESYLDFQRNLSRNETERAAAALETRVSALRVQLEEDQQAIQDFRGSAQGAALQDADALVSETMAIRERLSATEANLAALDALDVLLAGGAEYDIAAMRALIDNNEVLQRLEAETLEQPIGPEAGVHNSAALRAAIETERARLERLSRALSQSLDTLETRIEEADAYAAELRQLEVELDTTSRVYETALSRLKELTIQTDLRDAGAQILTRAEAPLTPSGQGGRRNVAIAGVLGLFLGMAWVLLREAANDRVRRPSDLVDLAKTEPIFQIPPAPKGMRARRLRTGAAPDGGSFLEGVRGLRQELLSDSVANGRTVIVGVFSALPNENKSTIANGLARSLGLLGKRTLLVDGDMRTGALSRALGSAGGAPGLRGVLSESANPANAIVSLDALGYDLLPAGKSSANAADLLESTRLADLISALRERYDVVLFDTPPLLVVPDARRIAERVDRHVLVTAHGHSRKPAVREALTALRDAASDRPILALSNVPEAFGRQYGLKRRDYARYVR